MKRDLQKDRDKMSELWDQEIIYDVNEIMEIAEHALNRAIKAEEEVQRLNQELENKENKLKLAKHEINRVHEMIDPYSKIGLILNKVLSHIKEEIHES